MIERDTRLRSLITAFVFLLGLGVPSLAWGQDPSVAPSDSAALADSLWSLEMNPVLVTATKTQKSLDNVTVPASVITNEDIEARGSVRLADLLREETTFQFDYSHGTGVQIQGLDPEYTLLLIDGEPMIGRTAGTLDLY
jgi:outer membrane receptor for ferrienterochelin and colicins